MTSINPRTSERPAAVMKSSVLNTSPLTTCCARVARSTVSPHAAVAPLPPDRPLRFISRVNDFPKVLNCDVGEGVVHLADLPGVNFADDLMGSGVHPHASPRAFELNALECPDQPLGVAHIPLRRPHCLDDRARGPVPMDRVPIGLPGRHGPIPGHECLVLRGIEVGGPVKRIVDA